MGLPTAALALQVAGLGTSASASYWNARSQKSALNYQANIADLNAQLSELGAESALSTGQQQAGKISMQAGQVLGRQRAVLAGNGVDLGTGSAAEMQASTSILKQIDMNTVQANAVRNAWGYREQGLDFRTQAAMGRASAAGMSPALGAATTLLGGAGQVASNWYLLSQKGAFGNTTTPVGGEPTLGSSIYDRSTYYNDWVA